MTRACLFVLVLMFAAPTAIHAEDDLGRLFYTPAQRAALDAGKRIDKPKSAKAAPRPRGPARITFNGTVIRSDGERTLWINERAYHGRDPAGMRVKSSPQAPAVADVSVPGKRTPIELRVGQTYRRSSGTTLEVFEAPADTTTDNPGAGAARAAE